MTKVDELMALCDRLEAQQQERETWHAALARASLARFADAPTPANLTFLFHPSYTIPPADLRKSILTLAVQGKLVPQDPNDEPVRKQKLRVRPDNDVHEIPNEWVWTFWEDVLAPERRLSRGDHLEVRFENQILSRADTKFTNNTAQLTTIVLLRATT